MIFSDVLSQGYVFAAGFFCGLASGIYYDVLYAVRTLVNAGRAVCALLDFVFCLLSAATFVYVMYLANDFDIKWFAVAALLCGFALERFSFNKPVALVTEKVYNMIIKAKTKILKSKLFARKKKEEGV